jgi:TonB-dependent receptor
MIVSVSNTVTETRNQTFTFNQNRRERDVQTLNFTFGGENSRLLGGKLDFTANFSPSKGEEQRFIPARAVTGVGFRFDRSQTHKFLTVQQISGPDILDPRNSTMTSLDLPEIYSRDQILGAQVNFRRAFATALPLAIKTGARYREQIRKRDQARNLYSYVGPNGVAGPVGAANDDDLGRFFDPGYTHVAFSYPRGLQFMKLPDLMETLRSQPQLFRRTVATSVQDTIRNDTRAEETVSALYLQGETRWGRLGLVTGVRMEETEFSASAYKQELTAAERARRAAWVGTVTDEEQTRRNLAEYGNPTRGGGDYRNYFPSVHLKYNASRNLLGRLSYSTGIGRPNFGQIIPTMTINNDNLTITSNNPDLQPQRSKNLDLSLEYYFEPAGLVSLGAFEKKLSNFIYRANVGRVDDSNNNRRFSVYADVINVFNTGTNHQYTYIKDRMTRNDLYTTVVKFGVSGNY